MSEAFRVKVDLTIEDDPFADPKSIYYDTIVIAGGSVKGFIFLGALQYLQDNYMIKEVTSFYGTSIGSAIAYLMAIGYTPIEIMITLTTERILEKFLSISPLNCFNGKGAMEFRPLIDFMEKISLKKIGYCPTLADIKNRHGKTLVIATHNLTRGDVEYLGPDSHPDLSALTAIKMSCSMPLMFEHCKYKDCFYVDGGISDNFPIDYALSKETGKIFGIQYEYPKRINSEPEQDEISLKETFSRLIYTMINCRMLYDTKNYPRRCTILNIKYDKEVPSFVNFDVSISKQLSMFSKGYQNAKDFYLNFDN